MKKAGKKAYMNRILVLASVIAVLCTGGERVCFGLANESPWPMFGSVPTWWTGLGADVNRTSWFDPCNWDKLTVPASPNNVGINPTSTASDPCTVVINPSIIADCNYLRLGQSTAYVNLIIQGQLNIGGPGLRVPSWTGYQKCQVIINGGTLNINGSTDQSYMIVNSGDVNVAGQIGLGAGANTNEVWSDQYYLKIRDGNVRAGDFVMSRAVRTTAALGVDINGTGKLVLQGDMVSRIAGYVASGWFTAYNGDANYVVSITRDDVNDKTIVKAGAVNAAKADINSPVNGATVPWEDPNRKGYGPKLTWKAGTAATSHKVYFGTALAAVRDANESSPQYKGNQALANKSYTVPLADISIGGTYYWRIDENDTGATVKGDVWQFSIMSYRVVDEFETYVGDVGLGAVWASADNAYITLETTTVQGGLQALNMSYNNSYSPYISETSMSCSALPGCPNDWTAAGVRILTLSLHGDPAFTEKCYVILESNGGAQNGIVYYTEPNELRQGSWEYYRFWAIDLAQFSAQGVNLKNITKLTIGVGNKASPAAGGLGTILIDSIRLQPPMCLARNGDADLDNDCMVNINDLAILADNWLKSSTIVTASAPAVGPVLWYKFDEGSNYDVGDSSGNSYNGYLNLADWGGAGSGYDGSNCLNLNNEAYVTVPVAAFNPAWGAECTISLWFKDSGQTDNDSMLFQVNRSDGTNRGPQVWMGSTGFMEWACGYDVNTGYRDFLWFGQNYNYSNPTHPLNRWVHYAFVKSASAHYMRVYQDGVVVAESTNVPGDKLDAADVNTFFSIGAWAWSGGSGGFCDGMLDDFRIYDYALSPGQVLSLALKGGDGSTTQLLLTPADIVPDGIVDFEDYAVMADKWHQQVLFP
jgi:hypothetical protein